MIVIMSLSFSGFIAGWLSRSSLNLNKAIACIFLNSPLVYKQIYLVKPNLVRDVLERAPEALKVCKHT